MILNFFLDVAADLLAVKVTAWSPSLQSAEVFSVSLSKN